MQWAIFDGFFMRVLSILNCGTTENKKNALFSLSNITGSSNKEHIRMFMEEEELVGRVIMLSNNDHRQLKGEATWVLTNAITCSTEEDRARFVQ